MDTIASKETFIAALVTALGADAVRCGDAIDPRHRADWSGVAPVLPLALLRPTSTEQVAAALRICHAHRIPVVPQGGMTGLAGGAVPSVGAVALSMERMNAIEQVDTVAATITVQAGATLQAVQEAMPFDYLPEVAARIQPTVRTMLEAMLAFAEKRER